MISLKIKVKVWQEQDLNSKTWIFEEKSVLWMERCFHETAVFFCYHQRSFCYHPKPFCYHQRSFCYHPKSFFLNILFSCFSSMINPVFNRDFSHHYLKIQFRVIWNGNLYVQETRKKVRSLRFPSYCINIDGMIIC